MVCAAERPEGFLAKFGATKRVGLTNAYRREKHRGWSGVLALPARREDLQRIRSLRMEGVRTTLDAQ